MTSRTTKAFRRLYADLPPEIQRRAKSAYKRWRENPHHNSLSFKQVHDVAPIFSVRITRDYRAVGIKSESTMIWFWIGKHSEYERVIAGK